jgi:hypothetical protein
VGTKIHSCLSPLWKTVSAFNISITAQIL